MKSFARQHGIYLLFGSDDYVPFDEESGGYLAYNGAKMITPEGNVTLRYHKNILVPFGEYIPEKELFFFASALTEGVSDFSPGEEVVVADVGAGSLGVFICYEAIYGELIREFVLEGAELLVNITNDAWFGRSSAPHQHLNMVVARAAETRRYLVRSANTGISAIVDPYGRVLKTSDLFVQDLVSGMISFRDEQTPFVRFGNVIGRASAAVTFLFALFAVVYVTFLLTSTVGSDPKRQHRQR
jgi:apolipoprotein N-acyltransferase